METTITLTPAMMAIVPIIAFVIKTVKEIIEPYSWYDKAKRFLPLTSLAIGIGLAYLFKIENPVVSGIMVGIAEVSGYETLKAKKVENTPVEPANNEVNPMAIVTANREKGEQK